MARPMTGLARAMIPLLERCFCFEDKGSLWYGSGKLEGCYDAGLVGYIFLGEFLGIMIGGFWFINYNGLSREDRAPAMFSGTMDNRGDIYIKVRFFVCHDVTDALVGCHVVDATTLCYFGKDQASRCALVLIRQSFITL